MANRHADWLRQGDADLRHARHAVEDGDYEWACFGAQQAAEKGVESVIQAVGGEGWGHSVTVLLGALGERTDVPAALVDAGRRLDKHDIPTRNPNGFDVGAPTDYYTRAEAEAAVSDAAAVLAYCHGAVG